MEYNLGIGLAPEPVPSFEQTGTEFPVIVDLTVERNPHGTVFVGHRLPAILTKINDAEPTMTQRHVVIRIQAGAVRPAMGERSGHAPDQRLVFPGKSGNTTHGFKIVER
jgi:hypothetical protein